MFIRVVRESENKEILVNTDMIWKIEVSYGVGGTEAQSYFKTHVKFGVDDPNAVRFYKVFVGGETIFLKSDPDDSVVKVIEDIYRASVKG